MIIRPIEKSEISQAADIVRKNYSAEYGEAATREISAMFDNPTIPPQYLVAEQDGRILGFAGYIQSWMDYNAYEIFWVNVEPEHQRRGIGSALVSRVLEDIREKEALTVLLTTSSPNYYETKFGFKTVNKFKSGKYSMMVLNLEEQN